MISKSKTSLSTSHQECHQDVAKQQRAIGGGGGSNGWFRVSNSSKYLLEKMSFRCSISHSGSRSDLSTITLSSKSSKRRSGRPVVPPPTEIKPLKIQLWKQDYEGNVRPNANSSADFESRKKAQSSMSSFSMEGEKKMDSKKMFVKLVPELEPVASFKIFLSYYEWDGRRHAIDQLKSFISKSPLLEVFDCDFHNQSILANRIKECDCLILFVNPEYRKSKQFKVTVKKATKMKTPTILVNTSFQNSGETLKPIGLVCKNINGIIVEFSELSIFHETFHQLWQHFEQIFKTKFKFDETSPVKFTKLSMPTVMANVVYDNRGYDGEIEQAIDRLCQTNSIMLVKGPSLSGKTTLMRNFFTNCQKFAEKLLIQYFCWIRASEIGDEGRLVEKMKEILQKLGQNCSEFSTFKIMLQKFEETLIDRNSRFLIVIDDFQKLEKSQFYSDRFVKLCQQKSMVKFVLITNSLNFDLENAIYTSVPEFSTNEAELVIVQYFQASCETYQGLVEWVQWTKMKPFLFHFMNEDNIANSYAMRDRNSDQIAIELCSLALKKSKFGVYLILFGKNFTFNSHFWAVTIDEPKSIEKASESLEHLEQLGIISNNGENGYYFEQWQWEILIRCVENGVYSSMVGKDSKKIGKKLITTRNLLSKSIQHLKTSTYFTFLLNHFEDQEEFIAISRKLNLINLLIHCDWEDVDKGKAFEAIFQKIKCLDEKLKEVVFNPGDILPLKILSQNCGNCFLSELFSNKGFIFHLIEVAEEKQFWHEKKISMSGDRFFTSCLNSQLQKVENMLKREAGSNSKHVREALLATCAFGNPDVVRFLR